MGSSAIDALRERKFRNHVHLWRWLTVIVILEVVRYTSRGEVRARGPRPLAYSHLHDLVESVCSG
jgi:hypothetical protein